MPIQADINLDVLSELNFKDEIEDFSILGMTDPLNLKKSKQEAILFIESDFFDYHKSMFE